MKLLGLFHVRPCRNVNPYYLAIIYKPARLNIPKDIYYYNVKFFQTAA
jgi:hypothetical protein